VQNSIHVFQSLPKGVEKRNRELENPAKALVKHKAFEKDLTYQDGKGKNCKAEGDYRTQNEKYSPFDDFPKSVALLGVTCVVLCSKFIKPSVDSFAKVAQHSYHPRSANISYTMKAAKNKILENNVCGQNECEESRDKVWRW